ncbi:hypothetical protein [Methylobacterium indicum]|uniref:Uncharacterized protein n=1 Tax=Methylobacterium indicum TaxID=1775910 RepID=A0A8H8X0R5_9HYPH|nr:hypothetical protein [Methylobacterium indicum]BCM87874.1 hypothetical protein mvi_63350 [Methylobacterium indicum]
MREIIVTSVIASLIGVTGALAQAQPIPGDPRRACPDGYTRSGSFCRPKSSDSPPAVYKPRGATCPYGTVSSGSGCKTKF